MIRFSCFHTDVHNNKPKKIVQSSIEAMTNTLQDGSQSQASINNCLPTSSTPLISKAQEGKQLNMLNNHSSNLTSARRVWRSEDLKSKLVNEYDTEICQNGLLKKSHSLESGLYLEGRLYTNNLIEFDTDPGFSCNGPKIHNESTISGCTKGQDANPPDKGKKNSYSQFHVSSGLGNDGSIFSIGDSTPSDKDARDNPDSPLSGGYAGDSVDHTSGPGTPSSLLKSCSVPNIVASTLSSGICSFEHASSMSRSFEDLHALSMRLDDIFINESDDQANGERARDNRMGKTEQIHMDNSFDDGFDAYQLSGSARDWVMPDDINAINTLQGESSVHNLDDLPNKDFKTKRIEDWVIGLEHCGPLEETNESSKFVDPLDGDVSTTYSVTAARVDGKKVTPGMEAAKRYISSLSANATAAHLANYGLVVIPLLSVFASLKVLNLSGNAIVRVNAGALPRGLHILNLSKNNISTIEGLRELTRLRVLDLSYNRILRIGHGLASCSSLKELYLAGNKISEVEGLHRLLKLSVLDLRFNKISTAKCLGQLAANYISLQAISLEGNPAQKNVGNEHLKKYLQGLLPHLAYYNRQPMKSSTMKDAADRSVRLGINSRSDHKTTRKSSHGVAARRPSTSSTHGRRTLTVESPKWYKGRQGQLPPIGAKVSTQSRHHFDVVGKLMNLRQGLSIRKSRSEGTIAAL